MLHGIDPLLGPDLLHCLRSMGHGDELAIVDGNYPADAHAKRLIRCDGHCVPDILRAVLSVLPIDDLRDSLSHAVNIDNPNKKAPIHEEMSNTVVECGVDKEISPQIPEIFYERVRNCYAIIATSESALYGNIVLRKGIIEN